MKEKTVNPQPVKPQEPARMDFVHKLNKDSNGNERIVSPLPTNNALETNFNDRIRYYFSVVEESFIESGLEPYVDYDFKDILSIAKPLILDAIRKNDLDYYWTY